MAESYTLHYFDGRGAGERTRWICKIGKIPFEDLRYSFPEQQEAKAAGKLAPNLGRLPILDVKGADGAVVARIPQSKAIERFLAKKVG